MEKMRTITRRSHLGLLLCALLTGCNVGPKYHTPAVPAPPAFKEVPPPAAAAAPANPEDGNWWAIFNDPELNDLESQLNINNQNLKQFFENFMEARALVRVARAQYFPTVSVGPSY